MGTIHKRPIKVYWPGITQLKLHSDTINSKIFSMDSLNMLEGIALLKKIITHRDHYDTNKGLVGER